MTSTRSEAVPGRRVALTHADSPIGRRLVKSLERQRIAWVRGVYLPDEITTSGADPAIRLAGS